MSFDDQEAYARREKAERLAQKAREVQQRKDVQALFALPEARRILAAFLEVAGADISPLRDDQLTTGHAIGWQDAASWWTNQLRTHCPEREVQMRAEAKREAAQPAPQDNDDD